MTASKNGPNCPSLSYPFSKSVTDVRTDGIAKGDNGMLLSRRPPSSLASSKSSSSLLVPGVASSNTELRMVWMMVRYWMSFVKRQNWKSWKSLFLLTRGHYLGPSGRCKWGRCLCCVYLNDHWLAHGSKRSFLWWYFDFGDRGVKANALKNEEVRHKNEPKTPKDQSYEEDPNIQLY